MAGSDPAKIDGFNKMSLIEYFLLLDQKISDVRKANKEIREANKKR